MHTQFQLSIKKNAAAFQLLMFSAIELLRDGPRNPYVAWGEGRRKTDSLPLHVLANCPARFPRSINGKRSPINANESTGRQYPVQPRCQWKRRNSIHATTGKWVA